MLAWPPDHRRVKEPDSVKVTFVPAKHVTWAILLAALVISAAIIANGERDRKYRRNHPVAAPAVRTAPSLAHKRVAVLPFQNLNGDSQNALVVAGIQADLVAQLAKIPDLKVVDLQPWKERQAAYASSKELGRDVGVDYLIRGTIQRSSTHIKMRAKLIRAEADQTIWTETYEFKISDPFSLDPDIAQKIAEQLQKRIGSLDSFAVLTHDKG